jgi:hypothetical protein
MTFVCRCYGECEVVRQSGTPVRRSQSEPGGNGIAVSEHSAG